MRAHGAVARKPLHVRPTWAELRDALVAVTDHLDFCGWGDAYERECSADLRTTTTELLRHVWHACSECGRPVRQVGDKGPAKTCHPGKCAKQRQARWERECLARKRAAPK